jgi:hypothetical protein
MLTRTNTKTGRPIFIKDHAQVVRTGGRQIYWAGVSTTDPTTGKKYLRAGTVCGELLGGGLICPRVATTNPATGILETDAWEDELPHAITGYGFIKSAAVYEILLPDSTGGPPKTLPAAFKTELQANCPMGFQFEVYQDNR